MTIDDLTTEECMTLDTETLELLNKQTVQERQAFAWEAALAMCGQYSIESADGSTFIEYVEDDFNNADELFQ